MFAPAARRPSARSSRSRPIACRASTNSSGRSRAAIPAAAEIAALDRPELFVEARSEEHTSELQSHLNLVCRLLLEKKNVFTTFNGSSAPRGGTYLKGNGTQ